jgi:hypothetical protein
MATTTPNFGWAVPTSTDLVKDGAVAIETLGDAIDASLVDLKGGTTGQVLSKASGTDMDFAWVSDAAGMTNPMTTTGDTIYSSSGSTPARLGIGTTGQVLTVAGGVPSWATPAAGGGGKVLQVVSVQTTTKVTIASTSLTDTGITASITPTSSTSKILVIIAANAYGSASVDNTQVGAALLRGATTLQSWDTGKNFLVIVAGGTLGYIAANNSVVYLDSPATTSSITYKLQANTQSTANSRQVVFQEGSAPGTITLMEIGA